MSWPLPGSRPLDPSGPSVGRVDDQQAERRRLGRPIAIAIAVVVLGMLVPAGPASAWTFVWGDEFNGTSIDRTKWNPYHWTPGNTFYDPANVLVSNGKLSLRARSASSSAIVQTNDTREITYGRVEILAKAPKGQGLKPALWLRPGRLDWKYPEIDILEMWMTDKTTDVYDEYTAWMTYHWLDASGTHRQSQTVFKGTANLTWMYHKYAVEWDPAEIRWYIDGIRRKTISGSTVAQIPMFIVLSFPVGKAPWIGADGEPNANTKFPAYFNIDYVRVYRR
jgi:beta-glucanase (GH16 family)